MNIKKIAAVVAGLSLCMCLASCGDTDSAVDPSSMEFNFDFDSSNRVDESSTGDASSTVDADSSSREEYDPNGDVRLFDGLKSQYEGNYKLTGTVSVKGGDSYPVVFEVKGGLRYASATVSGMMTERFITAEGDLYIINHATTTYEKYNSSELGNTILKSPQYDPFFSATGKFVKASVENGVIIEEYALDFEGLEGSVIYSFNENTRNILSVEIKSDDMDSELVSDIVVSAADDKDFEMPDISGYTRNN